MAAQIRHLSLINACLHTAAHNGIDTIDHKLLLLCFE